MIANVISLGIMSNIVAGVVVACCVILTVVTELTNDTGRPTITSFSRHINVFVIPLLSVVVYVFFIWGAKIVTG
jgi:hypothetical protein